MVDYTTNDYDAYSFCWRAGGVLILSVEFPQGDRNPNYINGSLCSPCLFGSSMIIPGDV